MQSTQGHKDHPLLLELKHKNSDIQKLVDSRLLCLEFSQIQRFFRKFFITFTICLYILIFEKLLIRNKLDQSAFICRV